MKKRDPPRSHLSLPPGTNRNVERWLKKIYGSTRPDGRTQFGKLFTDGVKLAKSLGEKSRSFERALYKKDWKGALNIAVGNYFENGSSEQITRVFIAVYYEQDVGGGKDSGANWVKIAGGIAKEVFMEYPVTHETEWRKGVLEDVLMSCLQGAENAITQEMEGVEGGL